MGIGDSILMVACLAGLMLALPALLIFLNIAFVGVSERAASRLSKGGFTPFLVGLGITALIGIPASVGVAAGSVLQFCGGVAWLFLLLVGFIGMASVSRLIGYRVTELNEREESPLIQALAGAFVLSFGIAFPVIGWVIVLPFCLIIGLGAIVMTTFNRIFGKDSHAPKVHMPRNPFMEEVHP
ncbi:MAG: hypothetical protein L0154_08695 [Chloroflexi bacterium]|nr:hypothetical protein [Chloroflexota bacterium]